MSRTKSVKYTFQPSTFNVIAFEDDTEVEITPTLTTTDGKPANVPFRVTLNKGDVYQVANLMEDMGKGLSGSQVYVPSGKKVAVYSGNKCSNVPDACAEGDGDILYDVSYPVSSWGKKFIICPFKNGNNDMIKCTACKDSTMIYKDGKLLATINAFESYEFIVAEKDGVFKLETSEPVAIYQYMTSTHYVSQRRYGGPSYQYVAPIEQAIEEITFCTISNDLIPIHYLNVVIKTEDAEDVSLNGKTNFATFTPIDEVYSTAVVSIKEGEYTLKAKNGFVANVYGAGEDVSYSYSVGSKIDSINGLPWETIVYDTICVENVVVSNDTLVEMEESDGKQKKTITYRHYRQSYTTSLSEFLCEGESYEFGMKTFNSAGEYTIPLVATNGCDSIVHLHLSVAPKSSVVIEETVTTESHYEGHGFSVEVKNGEPNSFTQNYTNRFGCDSIVTLIVKIEPCTVYGGDISESICDGQTFIYDNVAYAPGDVYTLHLTSALGCDSVVSLNLQKLPISNETISATILLGGSYAENGFDLPEQLTAGTFYHNLTTTNMYGCDSIVTLKLDVVKPVDNIVVPTMFTPYTREGKNDIFMEGYEVYIYDRYGNLVCHSTNGWNGYYRGEVAAPGVYIYTLYMKDGRKKKGSIEVIK